MRIGVDCLVSPLNLSRLHRVNNFKLGMSLYVDQPLALVHWSFTKMKVADSIHLPMTLRMFRPCFNTFFNRCYLNLVYLEAFSFGYAIFIIQSSSKVL